MSLNNAIKQRQDSILEYKRILLTETDTARIEDINGRIAFCEEQIELLRTNKPLFGKPKPLPQETRIYESNPEKNGEQKVTIITNSPATNNKTERVVVSENKVGNSLRSRIQLERSKSAENSLKAKVAAAKAAQTQKS